MVVREKEGCVLLRLGAAVEVAIEQSEDLSGGFEELAAIAGAVFPAGHEAIEAGLGVDELFAGESVRSYGGVKRGHQERG